MIVEKMTVSELRALALGIHNIAVELDLISLRSGLDIDILSKPEKGRQIRKRSLWGYEMQVSRVLS